MGLLDSIIGQRGRRYNAGQKQGGSANLLVGVLMSLLAARAEAAASAHVG